MKKGQKSMGGQANFGSCPSSHFFLKTPILQDYAPIWPPLPKYILMDV